MVSQGGSLKLMIFVLTRQKKVAYSTNEFSLELAAGSEFNIRFM